MRTSHRGQPCAGHSCRTWPTCQCLDCAPLDSCSARPSGTGLAASSNSASRQTVRSAASGPENKAVLSFSVCIHGWKLFILEIQKAGVQGPPRPLVGVKGTTPLFPLSNFSKCVVVLWLFLETKVKTENKYINGYCWEYLNYMYKWSWITNITKCIWWTVTEQSIG